LRKEIEKQCSLTSIFNENSAIKKKKTIIDSIAISLINSGISTKTMEELIKDINSNNVLKTDILKYGGDLFSSTYLNQKYVKIAKELFSQRSVGIGTPNAASGEGELMFLFLCGTKVKKPTSGDLEIDGKIFELKGDAPRISGGISGNYFRRKTLEVARKYNLDTNVSSGKKHVDAVEIEKSSQKWHYDTAFALLPDRQTKIDFVNE
jgi:hypothetical protein